MGAKKAQLPASPCEGTPAEMPQEVLQWEESRGKGKDDDAKSRGCESSTRASTAEDAAPQQKYLPESKYSLVKDTDGSELLRHDGSGDSVPLETLPKGRSYRLYYASEGHAVVWGGGDAKPEYAFEIFVDAASATQMQTTTTDSSATPLTDGTMRMPGMKQAEGQASEHEW